MSDVDVTEQAAAPPLGKQRHLGTVLAWYRTFAYIVGTGLVVLVLVGIPLQVWGHSPGVATYVGIAHGYLFMAYLIITFILAWVSDWHIIRVGMVALAGTIPFLSFYAERKVTGWVRADQAAAAARAAADRA